MIDVDHLLLGAVGVLGALWVASLVSGRDLYHEIIPAVNWGGYNLTEPFVLIPSLSGTAVLFHTAKLSGVKMAL